ncbi:hypothetical protein [Mycolicibacterium sp.]|uniref:hypothetical protein n=1 Tax=Mycolicibacterium sp. TaxID=2320850 RepID=UPI0037C65B4F
MTTPDNYEATVEALEQCDKDIEALTAQRERLLANITAADSTIEALTMSKLELSMLLDSEAAGDDRPH